MSDITVSNHVYAFDQPMPPARELERVDKAVQCERSRNSQIVSESRGASIVFESEHTDEAPYTTMNGGFKQKGLNL